MGNSRLSLGKQRRDVLPALGRDGWVENGQVIAPAHFW